MLDDQPINILISLRRAALATPTPVLRIHRTSDGHLHVTVAGHTDHLTVQTRRRRGTEVRVVLHHNEVVATFASPYNQRGNSPGLVWYRTVTGCWEGHMCVAAALRTLGVRHLPRRRQETAA